MIVMSLLRAGRPNMAISKLICQPEKSQAQAQAVIRSLKTSAKKAGGHYNPNNLQIMPSRYQWHIYKDQLHYYLLLGIIPLSALVFYANVFIGPATLCEIPEGYVPKQWEYYRNPIQRFFARYLVDNWQEQYERNMHYVKVIDEKRRMRFLAWKVERLMRDRGDYPNYYTTRTYLGQYARNLQIERGYLASTMGEDYTPAPSSSDSADS